MTISLNLYMIIFCGYLDSTVSHSTNGNSFLHYASDHNRITEVPSEIGSLSKLETLFLGKCPWSFSLILQIISCCKIHNSAVSQSINGNSFLHFVLDFNQITEVPSEIGSLSNLKELFMGKCLWIFFLSCHVV